MLKGSVAVVQRKEKIMGPRRTSEWEKVLMSEQFTIYQNRLQANLYRISYYDTSGKRHRDRIRVESLDNAITEARRIVVESSDQNDIRGLKVIDAFNEALQHSRRGERSIKDWNRDVGRFLKWWAASHPECTHWVMISRQVVREYLGSTLSGASDNHRRLRIQPIRQTANYMENEYGTSNVAKGLGIGSKLAKTPPMIHISDVADLLNYAVNRDIRLAVGIAFQGLVGLQMLEALRLTWDKVDLDSGLIEISGAVKNPYRNRVIPVPQKVIETLRLCVDRVYGVGVIPNDSDPVVPSPKGISYMSGKDSYCNYSKRLKRLIRDWNADVDWAPKDLRNAVPTFGVINGIFTSLWEQYIGHAPRTVTARHYTPKLTTATRGERDALDRQMDLFRTLIVAPIEAELAQALAQDEEQKKTAESSDANKANRLSG
jgi:integrase